MEENALTVEAEPALDQAPRKKPRMSVEQPRFTTHAQVRIDASKDLKSAAPPAVIRVRNLQATLTGPKDAWGRPGRPQPALISVEVWLRKPFATSSAADVVGDDTVHYGKLAKAVQKTLKQLDELPFPDGNLSTLSWFMHRIWRDLSGHNIINAVLETTSPSFLETKEISYLRTTLRLPKASLLGDGVSLEWASSFGANGMPSALAQSLAVHGLRIPTLVGVNANEREAKQIVTASLEVEETSDMADCFGELESTVVKTMEDSSFETLEALAHTILSRLKENHAQQWKVNEPWSLNIMLEKPIAVPYADAACVELRMRTTDV